MVHDVLVVDAARAGEAHGVHCGLVAVPRLVIERRHVDHVVVPVEETGRRAVRRRDGVEARRRLRAEGQFGEVRLARAGQAGLGLGAVVGQRRRARVDDRADLDRLVRPYVAVLVLGVALKSTGEVAGEARVAEDLDVALLRLLDDLGHLALQRLAREGRVGVLEPGDRVEVAEAPAWTSNS